jgi:hypothetical protein
MYEAGLPAGSPEDVTARRDQRPRVVMTLLVRDEIDIVRSHLDFHLALGVDSFVATDHLSRDGTQDVLAEYESAGVLTLFREQEDTYDQTRWVTRMARTAALHHGADWVINADADEFWTPVANIDLPSTFAALPPSIGRMRSWQYNFVPRPLEDEAHFAERMIWRQVESATWDGKPMGSKVCHRATPEVEIPMGNHEAFGVPGALTEDRILEVLHYPYRSPAQLRQKITTGLQAVRQTAAHGENVCWHWRQLEDQLADDSAWRAMCVDDATLATRLGRDVVEDRRVQRILAAQDAEAIGSPSPSRLLTLQD